MYDSSIYSGTLYLWLAAVIASSGAVGLLALGAWTARIPRSLAWLLLIPPLALAMHVAAREPFIYFLTEMMVVAMGIWVPRWLGPASRDVSPAIAATARRYSLLDFLVLTLVIGSVTGLIFRTLPGTRGEVWGLVVLAGCAAGLTVLLAQLAFPSNGKPRARAIGVLLVLLLALMELPNLVVDAEADYGFPVVKLLSLHRLRYVQYSCLFALVFAWQALFRSAGTTNRASPADPREAAPSSRSVKIVLVGALTALMAVPSAAVWVLAAKSPRSPVERDGRDHNDGIFHADVVATARTLGHTSLGSPYTGSLRGATNTQLQTQRDDHQPILANLRSGMAMAPVRRLAYDMSDTGMVHELASLATLFEIESELRTREDRHAEAAAADLEALRFCHALGHEALVADHGLFLDLFDRVIDHFDTLRVRLSAEEARTAAESLDQIHQNWEPFRRSVARQAVWDQQVFGWSARVEHGFRRLGESFARRRPVPLSEYHNLATLAKLRLMIIELEITAYRDEHGEDPPSLEQLPVARAVRQDPFEPHGSTLLRYERRGDSHIAYSVGPNRQDNGGLTSDMGYLDADISWSKAAATPSIMPAP